MNRTWDGITRGDSLKAEATRQRHQLIDAAKQGVWNQALAILRKDRTLTNCWRPDGHAWYTPLHHAAYQGVPEELAQSLIKLGAWRTLRTAEEERAVDIAARRGYIHLLPILEPVMIRQVPVESLKAITTQLAALITSDRAVSALVNEHALRLPELEPLLEFKREPVWFAVPGMYGGFNFWLEDEGWNAYLVVDSWSRMGDRAQRHLVSASGFLLVNPGHW